MHRILEAMVASNFYPEIPEAELDKVEAGFKRSDALQRTITALDDPLDEPSLEALEAMEIPQLYEVLEYIENKKGTIESIRESIRGQVAFVQEMSRALSQINSGRLPLAEVEQIILDCERALLEKLVAAGLTVDYETEVKPEEVSSKPNLILATHQGGGFENYLHQAMTGITGRLVVKDSLFKIPLIRDGLKARQAVPVRREMLGDEATRRQEILRIAGEVVDQLASGGNMFVFIEGTRSRSGEVASSEKRKAWAKDLMAAIDRLWAEYKDCPNIGPSAPEDFQKLLLVFNTKVAMPDAPEEKMFGTRFRISGTTTSARLLHADHLNIEESNDPYDPNTLFGKARSTLKEMLIQIILEKGRRD